MTRVSVGCVLAFSLVVAVGDARAQYFGRNKVEYKDFEFHLLSTEHFDVYYYRREEHAAQIAAQLAERWYARFSRLLEHELSRRQPLVLYGSQAEFAQTNVVSGLLSDSIGGVTEAAKRRIVMPFAPTLAETSRVLGHELVHAFQFDIGRKHGGWGQPLWFIEGMAEYLARGASDREATLWVRDAVLSNRLPTRERDAARRFSPYQYGHAFWSYLAQRFGDEVVSRALKPGKKTKLGDRMRHATGLDLDTLYADWRATVTSEYGAIANSADPRPVEPRPVSHGAFGRVQLGPSLSPDGQQAVFFSERDRFSLDLFLADVESGRIIRKLATTTASARFDSLQPLRSAGAWSPDGAQFAFAAVRQGQAALVIIDMHGRRTDREIVLPELGQVLFPTWSPDGESIAFSALAGGFTDLYTYALREQKLRRLTTDAFADLQPAWSPDGRTIAFSSERYSSDLAVLRFGPPDLAAIDVSTGVIRPLRDTSDDVPQINPQWSADGRHLYYVANPDGISNVYRLELASGINEQVTDVTTGVTGPTPTSPAITLANDAPVLGLTIYKNGRHQLALLDGAALSDPKPIAAFAGLTASANASAVKKSGATSLESGDSSLESDDASVVAEWRGDHRTGLPDPASIVHRDYTPRLSLERIGQPYVSSGGGAFGTFVRGGGSMLFGDMLGNRKLGAAVQIGNRLRDAAFEARFLNQEHRLNWGVIAELEPALSRYRRRAATIHDGEPALLKQADYLQRMQLRAAGLLAYPFSRGLRMEFIGGVRQAAYRRDLRSQVVSLATGRVLDEERVESSGGVPTTVGEIGAALVGDTTAFGATGPILGSRYRFEVSPAIGSLSYTRVLVDYRRYVIPVRPYSIAMRFLHSGRYGRDGDDPRLLSSFLGSRYLVRGHGRDAYRCQPDATRACGDDLVGNRLLVGNLELRFPLWGMLSRQIEYGPLPADAFFFADGGVVWSHGTPVARTETRRTVISSVGAGIRLNASGLPFELVGVRSLDGPNPRWSFDFGFRVGF